MQENQDHTKWIAGLIIWLPLAIISFAFAIVVGLIKLVIHYKANKNNSEPVA